MRSRLSFIALLVVAVSVAHVAAQTRYWDIDSFNLAGAGGVNPTGIWNSSISDWNANADGTGLPAPWAPGGIAAFAAGTNATGTYSVTVNGTQSLSGLLVEEGNITQNFGTLNFGAAIGAPINIASGSTWTESSTGVFTGTGGLTKTGAGTLFLRGTNTFSRSGSGDEPFLTINAGVVDFMSDANLGAAPSATDNGAALTLNGGTLRYSGNATFALAANRGVKIGASGGTIEVVNTQTLALAAAAPAAAALTGSGTLTKTGAGRFRLQTAQTTFTGKYIVKGGSLAFSDQNRLGALPASTQSDYFTLDGGGIYGDNSAGVALDPKRGITLGAGGGYLAFYGTGLSYDGIISGTQGGGLVITPNDVIGSNSSGTIALNSANTYNGPTQIVTGMTLSVGLIANGGVNSAIGSSSSAASNLLLDGGTLLYRGSAATTDRNFTLTATSGYIDASGANNAPLVFTSTAPIGVTGSGSRILVLRGTSTGDNTMSLAIVDQGTNPTTLNKTDAGTWVLTNTANSYAGNTVVSGGGRLKLAASGVIPDASVVQLFSSSFLDLNGYDETVKSIGGSSGTILLGSKTLTVSNPNGETYSAAITGAGGGRIIKNGAGKLTLSPTTASYDGGVVLNAGTLILGTNNALGTGPFVVNNNATLAATSSTTVFPLNAVKLAGNLTFDDSLAGASGAIVWGAGGNKWTISGEDRTITVSSAPGGYGARIDQPIGQDLAGLGLVKKGNGTLTLNGINTYTGATTVLAGTLSISKTYFADWAGVIIGPGATLNLNFPSSSPDTIPALYVDGDFHLSGTWGAIGSGAQHETAQITGTGILNVVPYSPPNSQPLPGDFNNDGAVDMADYITWRKANGTNNALLNDNGLGVPVGLSHLALWRQNYGNTRGAGSGLGGGTIPEPNSMLLALIGLAAWSAASRRQR